MVRKLAVGGAFLALLVVAAVASAAVMAGRYSGKTSEGLPVTFKIKGHDLLSLKTQLAYNGKCGQGGGPGYTISVHKLAIAKNGTFSGHIALLAPVKTLKNDPGTLKGKASGDRVSGSILDTRIKEFAGCKAPPYFETFIAHRAS